jgi:hypothetical protein
LKSRNRFCFSLGLILLVVGARIMVVMNRSKSSLTKEEIEAFWRSRQKAMEEHLNDAAAQKATVADAAAGSSAVSSNSWTQV